MASHRNISPSYAEAVARLSSSAAKSVKQDKTASKGTVSRLRYETEKRSLTGYATETYVDEGDASTLESAEAYADEAAQNAAAGVDLSTYATIERSDAGDASTLGSAESYTDAAVAEAIAGVYVVRGSCAIDDLPDDAEVGDVWNVTDGFELDGEEYEAGTNVVWTEDGWDALAASVDLSAYATTEYVDEAVAGVDLSGFADADSVAEALAALPQGLICQLRTDEDFEVGPDMTVFNKVLDEDDLVAGTADHVWEGRALKAEVTCTPYLVPEDEDDPPGSALVQMAFNFDNGSVDLSGCIRIVGTGTTSNAYYAGGQPIFSRTRAGVSMNEFLPKFNVRSNGDDACTVVLGAPIIMSVYDLGASGSGG